MLKSGLGCCVGNARPELKRVAHIVTKANGGEGAVREIIEHILKTQNKWNDILEHYKLAGVLV
jgi:3-deoxy-D-manno-octulosonate 8-phosphate phosphatase (KDO 8-P phosphatase)